MNSLRIGPLGIVRMRAPMGIDKKPNAMEMPQSRPEMGVTEKAAPPTNIIATWMATSAKW